ncbi:limbin [Nannospalax galili]|uniref:limbin n=1 Tax=Nannospalax galili TaxID=1026970 RepID=UPI0004ED6AE9|nr:limbin [Nannospalax galili]
MAAVSSRKLCCVAISLSEEELLRLRQEALSCFAQMDQSLALPTVRARVLLQQFQTASREAEFRKLDRALAVPELQSKGRKLRSKGKGKADALRKNLEDKIRLFEERPSEDLAEEVRGELLQEREQRLEAQEAHFAESLVALQFQKVAREAETLSAYSALLIIQDLLLSELNESETVANLACTPILESHNLELQELERKLEEQLAQQEEEEQQQILESLQQWVDDGPGPLDEAEEGDAERQVSTTLLQALSKGQKLLEHRQLRVREHWQNSVMLEDSLESKELNTLARLCSQGLRQVSYLSKVTIVPGPTLHRLLSMVLPSASQPQLLALLDSLSEKHSDHTTEREGSEEQAEPGRRRKHQGWWQALDRRLRADLATEGLQRLLQARRRKSILQKTRVPVQERVMFPGKGSWPHLFLEPIGELAPMPIMGAETIDVLNTGEKIFIFRSPREPEIPLHLPPRRKKNFLNSKKASRALTLD